MIRTAHALDLLTTPYVFSEEEARAMAEAGADIVVCHLGLTTGGVIGARDRAHVRRQCVPKIDAWARAAKWSTEVIVLCHGGPIATPEDASYILAHCRECHGSTAPPAWSGCHGDGAHRTDPEVQAHFSLGGRPCRSGRIYKGKPLNKSIVCRSRPDQVEGRLQRENPG